MKEFKNGQNVEVRSDNKWLIREYIGKRKQDHVVSHPTGGFISRCLDTAIREVEAGFIDLNIDWHGDRPTFDKIEICDIGIANLYELEDWQVGVPYKGWVLSGYVFDADVAVQDRALRFINGHRREVSNRATHGRFVKI